MRATITTSAGTQPGLFEGYANPSAEDYLKLRNGFLAEIRLIREKPASKEEVEDAKQYLLGSLPFRFTTRSSVASQLMAAERFGLGFDFLDKYQKEVTAVTPEDVLKVAEKYLHPNSLTIVAVGAIDQDGKPLPKKK